MLKKRWSLDVLSLNFYFEFFYFHGSKKFIFKVLSLKFKKKYPMSLTGNYFYQFHVYPSKVFFLILREEFQIANKEQGVLIHPIIQFPINILHLYGTFITINEPLWIKRYPKAVLQSDYFSFHVIFSFCSTIPFRRLH